MSNILLVDSENLLKIGYFGVKNYFYKGQHIGGIFHFLNTLKKCIETYDLDGICAFWDGEDGSRQRKTIYPYYKEKRNEVFKSEEEINSYNFQRERIKQYLEELFVRQGEYKNCETDDCIAYYVQNTKDRNKIIYSSDGDMAQLVSQNTKLFNPSHQKLYGVNDIILYQHHEILIENVKIVKMICGDNSDSISGIRGMGIKTMLSHFPELRTIPLTVDYIKERGNLIFEQNKNNKTIVNLLTGVTKRGVFGEEFFDINSKIIDLEVPFLTDDAKVDILSLINDNIDPEGRSYKNTMKMMIQDGLFQVLPKSDDAWIKFLNPFLRLTRKEKNKKFKKTIKIESYE